MKNKILIICMMLLSSGAFAQFIVSSTGDNSGIDPYPGDTPTGTLRQAIVEANAAGGNQTINFAISGTGPHTITLLANLPTLTANITINGFSQTGSAANSTGLFSGTLNPTYKIIIKSGVSGANTLFTLDGSDVIKGLVLEDCGSAGTLITMNGSSNQVMGCFIGMQSNGTSRGAYNASIGINVSGNGNIIGDGTAANINLISGIGNLGKGIQVTGSSDGTSIKGNIIGLQKNGTTLVSGNLQLYGIFLTSTSKTTNIGGTGTTDGNVISGQYGQYGSGTKYYGVGIYINSTYSTTPPFTVSTIRGNRIGTQSNGTAAVASNTQYVGIRVVNSKNNIIGGLITTEKNIISGNGPIPYQSQIWACGILVQGSTSTGNLIKGNYIGLDATGNSYVTNAIQFKGIIFRSVGTGNVIGGSNANEGNVISGNTCNFPANNCGEGRGIVIENSSSVTITGNIIGLKANGQEVLANAPTEKQYWGIEIDSASTNNIIGGTTSTTRNIISGNSNSGIKIGFLNPSGCTGNIVKGNYIGTQLDGLTAVTNNIQSYGITISGTGTNTIGGTAANEGNVISGNNYFGVYLSSSANNILFYGNIIGSKLNGDWLTGSGQTRGINIENSYSNTIGGTTTGHRNIISGNKEIGILITGSTSTGNSVKGNYIGIKSDGATAIVNPSPAYGETPAQDVGVWTSSSANGNTIGGSNANEGNVISANSSGIQLNSNSNTVYGNKIGPKAAADASSNIASNPQAYGIVLDGNSNTIGGNTTNQRNIISANTDYGIYIQGTSTSNTIKGNYIGSSSTATTAITGTSQDYGIYVVGAASNTIGGTNSGEENTIAFNTTNGVYISGTSATGNKITRNLIHTNTGKGINLNYGTGAGNNGKPVPVITSVTSTLLSGTAGANNVIEVFKNTPTNNCFDAKIYVGTATASDLGNGTGAWSLAGTYASTDYLLVTARDASNNTSEFSVPSIAGVASINISSICVGSPVTLSLTGNAGSIQWQSSTDNTNWTNISGGTTASFSTGIISTTTYFRASVINGACASAFSNTLLFTVFPDPIVTASASPSTLIHHGQQLTLTGSGANTYQWSNSVTNAMAFNPPVGINTYTVTGTDNNNCFATSTITVTVTKIEVAVEKTDIGLGETNSGLIVLTPSGGVPPYQYFWNTSATTKDLVGLAAGDYSVIVTDSISDTLHLTVSIGNFIGWDVQNGLSFTGEGIDNWLEDGLQATASLYNGIATEQDGWIEFKINDLTTSLILSLSEEVLEMQTKQIITSTEKIALFGLSPEYISTLDTVGPQSGDSLLVRKTSLVNADIVPNELLANTYAIHIEEGKLRLFVGGKSYQILINYNVGDVLRVGRKNGQIYFSKNGITLLSAGAFIPNVFLKGGVTLFNLFGGITGFVGLVAPIDNIVVNDCDINRNWTSSKVFDSNGNVISESKTYTDGLGRTTQTQARNISENNMLATQMVFDAFGRGALQTLPAPINQNYFCYRNNFITNTNETSYGYSDFDIPNHTTSSTVLSPGEVDNPKAVSFANDGTLGRYYSNNNSKEAYVPASSFPYSRVEYYNDPLARVKRTSAAGENHRAGSGHSQKMFYLRSAGELQYVYGYKGSYTVGFEQTTPDNIVSENLTCHKTVMIDADGKEAITYTNFAGNVVATCLSGVPSNCVSQKVAQILTYTGTRCADIHLPKLYKDKLLLIVPDAAKALAVLVDEGSSPSKPIQIHYKITDIDKEKLLKEGIDYDFDRSTREVTFKGNYANENIDRSLFLRISFEYDPTYLENRFNPNSIAGFQIFNTTPADLMVTYELDYSNWSINYYDKKGRLTKTVSPQVVNCSYDAVLNNTKIIASIDKAIIQSSCTSPTHTIATPIEASYDKSLKIIITKKFSGIFGSGDEEVLERRNFSFISGGTSNSPNSYVSDDFIMDAGLAQLAFLDTTVTLRGTVQNVDGSVGYRLRVGFEICETGNTYYLGNINHNYGSNISILPISIDANVLKNNNTIKLRIASIDIVKYIYSTSANAYVWDQDIPYVPGYDNDFDILYNPSKLGITTIVEKFPKPTPVINNSLVSTKGYNVLNWPIKNTTPDEGEVNIIYDTEGKIRFKQNAQQYADGGNFSYFVYDRAGRVVETGEYNGSFHIPTDNSLPLIFQAYTPNGGVPLTVPQGFTSVHSEINITAEDWALKYEQDCMQQTFYVYDVKPTDFPGSLTGYNQNYKDGQLVKSWNNKGTAWYGYDNRGRITWKVNSINGLGTKTINYSYTPDGLLDKMDYQKEISGERFVHKYLYDADKRMKETKTSFDNITFTSNQVFKYYIHGALKRNELGGNLQGLDYVYTINGQLKSVNDPTLTNRDPGKDSYAGSHSGFNKDVFGFTLDYFTGDYIRQNSLVETYTPSVSNTALPEQYSGQIKAIRWQTTLPSGANSTNTSFTNSGMLQYAYKYDNKNQLTEAIFGTVIAGTMNGSVAGVSPVFNEEANAYRVDNITYDAIGNIKTLKRQGEPTKLSMDDFTYQYDNALPNRLRSITDIANATNYGDDFKTQGTNNYEYNNIGQVTKDELADYNYTYNLSGNVTAVKKYNGNFVAAFEYNEGGLRQRKTNYDASGIAIKHTWYVYDGGGTLLSTYETMISTNATSQTDLQVNGSGRIGLYDKATGSYLYELSDHLGNVRAVIRKNPGNTNVEVLSFADYYPHGSVMPGRSYTSSIAYRFAYQGQEKDSETGFINFELRQYDARIGRWFNPDPMGQYHSPYLAMGNNPISQIDPTGGWGLTWTDGPEDDDRYIDESHYMDNYNAGQDFYGNNNWLTMTPYERNLYQDRIGTSYDAQFKEKFFTLATLGGYEDRNGRTYRMNGDGVITEILIEVAYTSLVQQNTGETVGTMTHSEALKLSTKEGGWYAFGEHYMEVPIVVGAQGGGVNTDALGIGLNVFGLANGAKTEIIDYAVRSGSSQAGMRAELQTLGKAGTRYLNAAKGLSKGAGILGVATTAVDAYQKGEWENHHTADVLIGIATTFMMSGPWGWVAGGAYFLIDMGVKSYTGKSITENLFDEP